MCQSVDEQTQRQNKLTVGVCGLSFSLTLLLVISVMHI